ncbi:MAG: hypothetical protein VX793_00365 [Pseudomonadota bacterium]|nr:hypothetical protein [Pseudomonadota bacterium]
MKKRGFWIPGLVLLTITSGAHGAFSATELAMAEADAWRARMGFHLLSIRGDNPEDREALKQLLAQGRERIQSLKEDADANQASQAAALDEAWEELSVRAKDNPLASLGYADYGAMSEMNTTTLAVSELADSVDSAPQGPYPDIADLSVAIQRLASEYLALAAFPSAGLPTGTGLPPMDFAMEAKGIDDSLKALEGRYADDAQAAEVLAFVNQRWAFVRNTIPRMNEADASKIPYLFYRYATQIAERVGVLVEG